MNSTKVKNTEYKNYLVEILSLLKDKAAYLKSVRKESSFSESYYEGQKLAYYHILDSIVTYIECNDDLTLEELGMDNFDPGDILDYSPQEA